MQFPPASCSIAALAFVFWSFEIVRLAHAAPSSPALQNILKNTDQSDLYGYPTDLTRGIIPIPVHSHNDYWRDLPFYSALSAGCISIEADVWLFDDTLLVGHDLSSLTKSRTLKSLYVDPILDVLRRQNPRSPYITGETRNGVYDTDPFQTLYLFIDVKTSGPETWPHVVAALEPLRAANYLTTLRNNDTLTAGPVTVIGTGNTPLSLVGPVPDRDYFYDGPLADLQKEGSRDITKYISPIASTNFAAAIGVDSITLPPREGENEGEKDPSWLNSSQLGTLRGQIEAAKKKGIGARYWGTPGWPVRERNEVWRTLLKEGVVLLNADDLEGVQEYF
ncbi:PI-PLCc_GDPD_SF superfamily domain-containing protein [Histoplasma capsulatum G186AR]|uniref:PI-PLCc_GDPD_SF superfamily domain-containing protein n=1 Tax=Ajellomyces capsulatus TaxID=5037 RepID=A0A8H7ZCR9_AJECA|nr:PI-PLCc_GDPD_SF superfamily domain-containing protein [Histoplasma capsulatum]QSS76149.1 PI-PLCc_GDPD_SF superfamily domain-containing protein [Histoplasma capsulatum G186AR]